MSALSTLPTPSTLVLSQQTRQHGMDAVRALRVRASSAGTLHAQGRLWATFDHTPRISDAALGDHLVSAKTPLRLLAGQGVVLEALDRSADASLKWLPDTLPLPQAGLTLADWDRMGDAWRDLRHGLRLTVRAASQLALHLLRHSKVLIAGRGRVLGPLETNQP